MGSASAGAVLSDSCSLARGEAGYYNFSYSGSEALRANVTVGPAKKPVGGANYYADMDFTVYSAAAGSRDVCGSDGGVQASAICYRGASGPAAESCFFDLAKGNTYYVKVLNYDFGEYEYAAMAQIEIRTSAK